MLPAELAMQLVQVFQLDWKPQITSRDYILDFEVYKLDLQTAMGRVTYFSYFRQLTLKFNFWMIRANFFDANSASCSLRAPVHTTLPDLKMSAVVLGSRIRMTTPLKRAGLYSVLRVRKLIVRKLSSHPKSIVATQFLKRPTSHHFQYGQITRLTEA